jgi:outer membrane murein-binding lipoprotein Lpp
VTAQKPPPPPYLRDVTGQSPDKAPPADPQGGGTGVSDPPMDIRLARLETAFGWVRWSMAVMVTLIVAVLAFVGFQVSRVDSKIDDLAKDVRALPSQISDSVREANRAFADAVNTSLNVLSQRPPPSPPVIIQLPAAPTPQDQPKNEPPPK